MRTYSEYDLRLKLLKTFSSLSDLEQSLDSVMLRLKTLNLLNDDQFAENKARGLTHKGNRLIKQILEQKGVDGDKITQAIGQLDDESIRAYTEAKKKMRLIAKNDPTVFENKLFRFLFQRGFSSKSTHEAIRKLREEGVYPHQEEQ